MAYSLENEEYDQVLAELYDKYKHVIQISPELKLAGMLSMSAISFAITKKMMGGSTNSTPNILGTVLSMFSGGGGNGMMKELNKTTTEDFEPSKLKIPTLNDSDSNDGIDEIFKKWVVTYTRIMKNTEIEINELKVEIKSIIQHYHHLINDTKTLWEVVCDIIDIDYDDDNIGEIFDEILKEK